MLYLYSYALSNIIKQCKLTSFFYLILKIIHTLLPFPNFLSTEPHNHCIHLPLNTYDGCLALGRKLSEIIIRLRLMLMTTPLPLKMIMMMVMMMIITMSFARTGNCAAYFQALHVICQRATEKLRIRRVRNAKLVTGLL